MKREVQAVMLVLLGAAVTRIALTDTYLRYVKASMKPFLLSTGAILLVLGLWALWDLFRKRNSTETETVDVGAEEHDGHGHGKMRVAWLLLLPVLSNLIVAPPALGAYSAQRQNSTVLSPAADVAFDPIPPGNPAKLSLSDYATRAIWDKSGTLSGRSFELTGFVTPVPPGQVPTGMPAGSSASWWLTRLALTCCAADATTTKVLAVGPKPLAANTWVTVTGRWIPGGGTDSSTAIPWLKIEKIEPISQPKEPYE